MCKYPPPHAYKHNLKIAAYCGTHLCFTFFFKDLFLLAGMAAHAFNSSTLDVKAGVSL